MIGVMCFVMGVIFGVVGTVVANTDAAKLLRLDRRTGYAVYQRVLKRGGTEAEALSAAQRFYRLFGYGFAVVGLSIGIVNGLVFTLTGV